MKTTITLFTLMAALFSQLSFAKARIPIPYGTSDNMMKMVDLPDTDEFKLDDGSYFDIGSYYTYDHILWLAYSNSEPEFIGYIEGSDEYLILTAEELKEIVEIGKVELPAEAEVSFMHSIGGKIVLGILGLIILYGVYSSYFGKDEDELEDEVTRTEA